MCFFLDPSPVRRVPIQTGIQRKLNFVSVRTIKGSSSWTLECLFRSNVGIHRARKAIQVDGSRPRRRSWLRFPWLSPIRNPFELRGLCRRSYFGPRTCGRSINHFSSKCSGFWLFSVCTRSAAPGADFGVCGPPSGPSVSARADFCAAVRFCPRSIVPFSPSTIWAVFGLPVTGH